MAAPPLLNDSQQRRILANAEYADKLLADIENILAGAAEGRLFRRYHPDVTPQQARLLRSSIAQFRRQLGRFLEAAVAGSAARPHLSALHSILVTLAFVRVAIHEMAPEHLRGYGELDAGGEAALRGVTNELESLVTMLEAELRSGAGVDLEERLARAPAGVQISGMLRTLDRIIREADLPEFRPSLLRLVEKIERPAFELAVFGRVSCGKSSLLNRLLGAEVLPVGVTPVTAVPVRVLYGAQPGLTVHFAGGRVEQFPVDQLPLFATEEMNPANRRGVFRLAVRLPSPILQDGVVFVDTPGLGSLATAGAAETISYLPQCDLGLVLVAAVTPLNEEDLATVDLLVRSGTRVMVLLSKADLASATDLERAMRYTAEALRRELGTELPVAAVSTAAAQAGLLEAWWRKELAPVLQRHKELAAESLHRKARLLRASVAAALRRRLEGSGGGIPRAELEQIEDTLRRASAELDLARREGMLALDKLREMSKAVLGQALEQILSQRLERDGAACASALRAAAARVCSQAAGELLHRLQQLCTRLSAALDVSRRVMRPGTGPPAQEFSCGDVRGLPVPPLDLLPEAVRLAAAAALPWAGRWFAAASLERQAGGVAWQTLNTYSRSLEAWLLRQLDSLQQRYDAEAGIFRAEIARTLSAGGLEPEHRQRLERWLRELDGDGPSETPHHPHAGEDTVTPVA